MTRSISADVLRLNLASLLPVIRKDTKKRMDKILFPQSIQDMCSKKLVLNSDIQIDFLRKYYMSIFNKYIYVFVNICTCLMEFFH